MYFAPDPRAVHERGLSREDAWAEYAMHAVTSGGKILPDGVRRERMYNSAKAESLDRIEPAIRAENVFATFDDDPRRDSIVFVGMDAANHRMEIVTRLDEYGNAAADLAEVTVVVTSSLRESPPPRPLAGVVEAVAQHQAAGFSPSTPPTLPQSGGDVNPENARYAVSSRRGGYGDDARLVAIAAAQLAAGAEPDMDKLRIVSKWMKNATLTPGQAVEEAREMLGGDLAAAVESALADGKTWLAENAVGNAWTAKKLPLIIADAVERGVDVGRKWGKAGERALAGAALGAARAGRAGSLRARACPQGVVKTSGGRWRGAVAYAGKCLARVCRRAFYPLAASRLCLRARKPLMSSARFR